MGRKRFKDVKTPGSSPKQLVKFATDTDYYIRFISDDVWDWKECWPTISKANGGQDKRRFVADADDRKNENLTAVMKAKESLNLSDEDVRQWNVKTQYAMIGLMGTPVKKKVKKNGKVKIKTTIDWNKEAKIIPVGWKLKQRFDTINENEELIEKAEEAGNDMDEISVLSLYSFKMKKIKTGGGRSMVDYSIDAYKLEGMCDEKEVLGYNEAINDLENWTSPSTKQEVNQWVSNIVGNVEEADYEEEEDEEDEETAKKKGKKKKLKKPVEEELDDDEDEDDEEDEDDDEEIDPDEEDEEDDEEIDPDDEDVELEEEEDEEEDDKPVKKKKKKKLKK